MKKTARTRYLASLLALMAAAAVVCGTLSAADPTADLSASRGAVTLASGANVSAMKTGDAPQSLKVGDVVSTGDTAGAKISLSKKDVLRLAANSTVTIQKWELSPNKKALAVAVSLDSGVLTIDVRKVKGKVVCDLEVAVGQAVLSGNDLAGKVSLLAAGNYSVNVTRGTPLLQSGRTLVRLASGATVNEGPPMTITASAGNDGPLPVGYIGVVGLVLLPGQSVSLEATDDGLRVTNTGGKPLYFCPWDKNAPQKLPPGEPVLLDIPELVVGEDMVKDGDRTAKHFVNTNLNLGDAAILLAISALGDDKVEDGDRTAKHFDRLIEWIRNKFPDVFPPVPKPWHRGAGEPGDGVPDNWDPPTRGPRGYHGSPSG